MLKQISFIMSCLAAFALPLSSEAAIYKHVDKNGLVTYSNVKIKGGKKINIEPADTSFGTKSNTKTGESNGPVENKTSPKNFPKVDANTQKNRDNSRKQILKSELESEKKALAAARKAHAEGAKNPETFKTASGATRRNVSKYQEKMEKLQADVDLHQRNVELLEKEINNIE